MTMTRRLFCLLALTYLLVLRLTPLAVASEGPFRFRTIEFPGADSTLAFGVNDSGHVVGSYSLAGRQCGFVLSDDSFTTVEYPEADGTQAFGVNDAGQIVGGYSLADKRHGFVVSGGIFSTVDFPGADFTEAYGINKTGRVVGGYCQGSACHGFLFSGGKYSTIDFAGADGTNAFGVNDAGQVVGYYHEGNEYHGFLLSGGRYSTITFPGSSTTVARGINAAGQIVGGYFDANVWHGYLLSGGGFSTVDFPGASFTEARGINGAGQVVGRYSDESRTDGFLGSSLPKSMPDFNADGEPDLVWQHQASGQIGVWFMHGTTQTGWSYFDPPQIPDTSWKIVGTGDFNGDGKPDLVWQNQASGYIGVWLMDGAAQTGWSFFSPPQVSDTQWKIVGVDDFNADGEPDLVWQHQASGQIGVWFMQGASQTSWAYFAPSQAPDANWKIVSTGDFNGDGKPDLVWQNQASGYIGVWLMDGTTQSSWSYFNPAQVSDPNWRVVGASDFNADGGPDLVWQNRSTGQIGVWFMSGVSLSSISFFVPGQRITQVWNLVTDPILPISARDPGLRNNLPLLALGLIAPVILYFRQKR